MSRFLPRTALLASLAIAGCADILGFPDSKLGDSSGSGGTGGSGGSGGSGCEPGATETCYSGPAGTKDVGICHGGISVCKADGSGFDTECFGETLPKSEDCTSPGDEDCDGLPDGADSDCTCTPGAVEACYEGPAGTQGAGLCAAGTRTCDATGKAWGTCMGQVLPAIENCSTPADEDCDGLTACSGAHRWSRRFGDAAYQSIFGVATDAAGNVFFGGHIKGTVDFGGGPLADTGENVYVAKLDPTGKHLWSKRFAGGIQHGFSLVTDASGNVIIAGEGTGPVDFGAGQQMGSGDFDVLVAKLDPDGNLVFGKLLGGAGQQTVNAVAADASGNVLVTGFYKGPIDFGCATGALTYIGSQDLFVAKLDPLGACVWNKSYGDAFDQRGHGIAATPTGDVYVVGAFAGLLDFGAPYTFTEPMGGNLFIAKLSGANGATLSAAQAGDSTGDQTADSIAVDPSGNVYYTGYYTTTLNISGGLPGAVVGGLDALLVKLDANGGVIYIKRLGGTGDQYGEFIAVNAAGEAVVIVNFTGTVDFGAGPLTSAGSFDVAVAKFAANGALLWNRRFGDAGFQTSHGVAVDASGSVLLGINNAGVVDLGGGPLSTAGDMDIVVAKLAP